MGGTEWRNLEMAHMRQSGTQEHHQETGRRPQFHLRKQICAERGRQILVGLGGCIHMQILDTNRRI